MCTSRLWMSVSREVACARGCATRVASRATRLLCMALMRLAHLDGLRFFLALWVVVFHTSGSGGGWPLGKGNPPYENRGELLWKLNRLVSTWLEQAAVRSGVVVFVILSGFTMHWVHGSERMRFRFVEIADFYVKRFDRVLLSTWVTMGVSMLIPMLLFGKWPDLAKAFGCSFFLYEWVMPLVTPDSSNYSWSCPNFPAWAIGAAFLPSWVLYPLVTRPLLQRLGACGLLVSACAMFGLSFGFDLVAAFGMMNQTAVAADEWPDKHDRHRTEMMYVFPPFWLPPFAFGAACAGLVRLRYPAGDASALRCAGGADRLQPANEATPLVASPYEEAMANASATESSAVQWPPSRATAWRWVCMATADLSAIGFILLISIMPTRSGKLQSERHQILLMHSIMPFVGLHFIAASAGPHPGLFGSLFRHAIPVSLSKYSFEAYLWHIPLLQILTCWGSTMHCYSDSHPPATENMATYVAFLVLVWVVAGTYAEYVQNPLTARTRRAFRAWKDRQVDDGKDFASAAECALAAGRPCGRLAQRMCAGMLDQL